MVKRLKKISLLVVTFAVIVMSLMGAISIKNATYNPDSDNLFEQVFHTPYLPPRL